MTLRDQGFRFIKRGDEFKWAHPADVQASDTDCTDMGDDEFAAFVASNPTVPAQRRGHQICSLATAGHRGAEMLSDAASQVAPAGRREDVVSRFDGEAQGLGQPGRPTT